MPWFIMSQHMVEAANQPWVTRLVERIRKGMCDEKELWYRVGPYMGYDCSRRGASGKFTFRRNSNRGGREEEFICRKTTYADANV